MKKNILIILMILLSGCRLDYYTKAEIAYKVATNNIKITADKITLTGYFENLGETKNTGIKEIDVFIEVNNEDTKYGRTIEAKSSSILNNKLKEINLKEGEKKYYELIFDKESSDWDKLEVVSIQTEVYYY